MKNKGDYVKINFDKLDVVPETLKNIKKFDKEYNGIHKITDISIKNAYSENEYARYELDGKYVFNEDEII